MKTYDSLVALANKHGFLIERENRRIGGEYIRYSLNNNKGMEYECRTLQELAESLAEAIEVSSVQRMW
jgi:hypothetical protein